MVSGSTICRSRQRNRDWLAAVQLERRARVRGSARGSGEVLGSGMKELITARVEAVNPWIDHGTAPRYPAEKVPREAMIAGAKRLLGLGKPVAPRASWNCGTDVVWPVYEINGKLIEPENGRLPYVCRHQIVAGD